MGLNPIGGGLRRFVNDSHQIAKLDLRVGPGVEIAVDDETAAQLPASFKEPDAVAARDAARLLTADDVRAVEAEPADDDEPAEPVKKGRKAKADED